MLKKVFLKKTLQGKQNRLNDFMTRILRGKDSTNEDLISKAKQNKTEIEVDKISICFQKKHQLINQLKGIYMREKERNGHNKPRHFGNIISRDFLLPL